MAKLSITLNIKAVASFAVRLLISNLGFISAIFIDLAFPEVIIYSKHFITISREKPKTDGALTPIAILLWEPSKSIVT
ncbi:MAG: hypothetical protein KTR26_17180 [Flammeovirgaceae bacterium]|nr:hypothetical protein [Flammeovirgaceae bacterium]